MKEIQYLDFDWYYCPEFQQDFIAESQKAPKAPKTSPPSPRPPREPLGKPPGEPQGGNYSGEWEQVQLPHSKIELPNSYFDDREFASVSAYRRSLYLPPQGDGQVALLRFEGVMNYAEIYLNGKKIGSHKGGYTPFEIVLPEAPHTQWDAENQLLIRVDSRECPDTPPFGFVIDYLTYGGIYRDVSLQICESLRFGQVKLTPIILGSVEDKGDLVRGKLQLELEIANPFGLKGPQELELHIAGFTQDYRLSLEGCELERFVLEGSELANLKLWDIQQGNLYRAELRLGTWDSYTAKLGFRDCRFTPDGFWINGRYEKLVGLNRHQSYPYAGYAMPVNAQKKDADLFLEYGCNVLRTSHYPQHREFIEYCDEIGLLVFTEIPGWQHIGESAEWHEQVLRDVRDMILRDYNSPSIILWGVRINESLDHSELYTKTNALARSLDPTRQTGGVRCHPNSELLEDVYTMNNFVLDGRLDERGGMIALSDQHEITGLEVPVPYLVSESNGHMFPTKAWDPEERRTEHAVRHLRVIDAAFAAEKHCGSISWCAFDYNTHHEFGSGDKICHHGVFDMYRQPKYAAWAYRSQKDPSREIVLQPLTAWARGERASCVMGPVWVLHNCDYIEFYIKGRQRLGKIFPARSIFKGLPHSPSVIWEVEGLWGEAFGNAEIKGFIGGKQVASYQFPENPSANQLLLESDESRVGAERVEGTRLNLRVVDQVGSVLPFFMGCVRLRVTGPKVKIYADEVAANREVFSTLRAGCSAIWLLSAGEEGRVEVEASVLGYPKLTASAQVLIAD